MADSKTPLIRAEVLASRRQRLDGRILLTHQPTTWMLTLFFGASVLAAVAFLIFGSYARTETVVGKIIPSGGLATITPWRSGVVIALNVGEDSEVVAGTELVVIRVEQDLAQGDSVETRALEALSRRAAALDREAKSIAQALAAEHVRLDIDAAGANAEITALDEQIRVQRDLLERADSEWQENQPLAEQGTIPRREIERKQEQVLLRRQELASLEQQRIQMQTRRDAARQAIAERRASTDAELARLAAARAELTQHEAQLRGQQSFTLTAPIDGSVTALIARVGQAVQQGQQLMTIVPIGGHLEAELYVPTRAAGFLTRGQDVKLKIDAFPFQRFGTIGASIDRVSRAPVLPDAVGAVTGQQEPVYLVSADMPHVMVRAFGRDHPLLPGMTLRADIVTAERSLFEWLFEPIFAIRART